MAQNGRVLQKNLVAKQLPEFIRSEYPGFVAFVEAYYEYLDNNNVDLVKIRDIDTTLDEFIKHFKTELAHNYPISDSYDTERYLLKHVRDQYLAKGSEASYKLLFRLLYSKDVYLDYPGKQMLRISDGRWQQDVSLFVRVDLGDPYELVGKIVDIQTSKKINIDTAVSKVTANVEKIIKVSGTENIYEFFLDRKLYGEIQPDDVVKYGSVFQGQILPCTATIKIQNKGQKFRPGQVFQIQFGEGSSLWFKVLTTDANGGLEKIDIIRFGIGYKTDFSIELLPTSAVSTQKKLSKSPVAVTFNILEGVIGGIGVVNGGGGYQFPPEIRFSDEGSGAVAHSIIENGQLVEVVVDQGGSGYTEESFALVVPLTGDTVGAGGKVELTLGNVYNYDYKDVIEGFTENGYLNWGDYWDCTESGRGAKAEAIIRENVLSRINVTNIGQDYTNATVSITDPTGFGANARAVIRDGVISSIPVLTGGGGYTHATVEILDGDGAGASVLSELTDGVVSGFTVINGGSNYDNPQVTFVSENGSGAEATATVVGGVITALTVVNGGTGYTKPPTVLVSDKGGSGAVAHAVIDDGEIVSIVIDKYGYGYNSNPTIRIVGDGDNATAYAEVQDGKILAVEITRYGYNYSNPTITISGDGLFAEAEGEIVDHGLTGLRLLNGGHGYNYAAPVVDICFPLGVDGTPIQDGRKAQAKAIVDEEGDIIELILTDTGSGYSNYSSTNLPLVTISGAYGYANGAYVGTVARQFYVDARDTIATNQAVLNVSLDAVARYPGYYKTNDGFLSDSMYIQDSFYYQAFSYVIRIDEQLQSYAAVVRTMLHPSGMALFGEYSINNNIALKVALDSLVKSLGVTLYDTFGVIDKQEYDERFNLISGTAFTLYKDFVDPTEEPVDAIQRKVFVKYIFNHFINQAGTISDVNTVTPTDTKTWLFTKAVGYTGSTEKVFMIEDGSFKRFTKNLEDTQNIVETYLRRVVTKTFNDYPIISEQHAITFTLNTILNATGGTAEIGFVVSDPYETGQYQAEHYSNTRPASWTV